MPKSLAVSLLGRKDYPEKLSDLRRVLSDDQESPKVRHTAAIELGRMGSPEAIEVLQGDLDDKDSFVRRGVLTALERAGGRESLEAIQSGRGTEEVARSSDRAEALLVYRLGERGGGLPFPPLERFLPINPARARSITFEPVPPDVAALAVRDLTAYLPSMRFAPELAVQAESAGRALLFAPSQEFTGPGAVPRLRRGPGMVGVVAALDRVETDTWTLQYYVLTQPADQPDRIEVMVATLTGTVAFAGEARVDQEGAEFVLSTVEHAGAVPLELRGRYQQGRLSFEEARTELGRTRAGRPVPRLKQGP